MDEDIRNGIIATFVVICLLLVLWIGHSHFEAKSFNIATGKSITTWQAMWLDLRVVEKPE